VTTTINIGPDDAEVVLTSESAEDLAALGDDLPPTTLLTVRAGKDTDLTEPQLRALSAALLAHADYIAQGAPMTPARRIARTPRFRWDRGMRWELPEPRGACAGSLGPVSGVMVHDQLAVTDDGHEVELRADALPVLRDSATFGALLMRYLDQRSTYTVPDPVLTALGAYGPGRDITIEALVVAYEAWR
jgi:hypothetical protein